MHWIGPEDAAPLSGYADSVVRPGHGMAVAQAQHAVKELANELEKRGVNVSYAIYLVAGRMLRSHERAWRRRTSPTSSSRRWTRSIPRCRRWTSPW